MKFRVDRSQFAEAVSWAGRTIPSHPHAPALAGLHLEATEGPAPKLTISNFDYEVSGRVEISADVFSPGAALVSGRLLVDISRALPAQPAEIVSEGSRLHIRCGRSNFELPGLPAEDYPQLPTMPAVSGTLPGDVLAAAVSQVAVAASRRDDAIPHLAGVRIEVSEDRITLAATDKYRLAVRTMSWKPATADFTAAALVPARTLADTAKALATADEVRLAFGSQEGGAGLLGIEGMSRRTTTRLLTGEFPSYRKLFPAESPIVARVQTAALIDALKRVALVAERSSAVRMHFTEDELVLEAGSGDAAIGVDAIECTLTGGSLDPIAFNASFLLEGLVAIGRPVTNLAFTIPEKDERRRRPAVLSGADSMTDATDDDYRYLLMPIFLPSQQ